MKRVRDMLRSGDWLTRERVRLVAVALLIASVAGFLFLVVTAHGEIDRQGRPLGTDFSNVYAAGTYVLEGNPMRRSTRRGNTRASRRSSAPPRRSMAGTIRPTFFSSPARLAKMPYGTRARGLAGEHACSLSADDLGDYFSFSPRAGRRSG